jgi:outer membrane protein TolC
MKNNQQKIASLIRIFTLLSSTLFTNSLVIASLFKLSTADAKTVQVSLEELTSKPLSVKEQLFIDLMAQWGKKNTQLLSLQDAISQGLQNNLSLQSQGLQYEQLDQALKEISAVFDPLIQINANFNDNKTIKRSYIGTVTRSGFRIIPDDMNPFEIPPDEDFEDPNSSLATQQEDTQPKVIEVLFNKVTAGIEHGYEIEASKEQKNPNQTSEYTLSLSQTLPWGGEMSLSSSNSDHDIYYRKDFHWDRSWSSNMTFDIETALPFSKNFAQGYDKQLKIQLAEIDKNTEFWQVKKVINELLSSIDLAYWDLVLSYEQLYISQENLQLLEQKLQHNQFLYKQLMLTQYDLKQIIVEVAGAKVSLQKNIREALSASMQLKQLISRDINSDESLFIPYQYQKILQQPFAQPFSQQTEYEKILSNIQQYHPQMHIQKLSLQTSLIRKENAHYQTRPDVTLKAEVNNLQDNSKLAYQGLADAFKAKPDVNSQSYQLNYQYPLFNLAVKSRLKQSRLSIDKQQLVLQELTQQLQLQVDQALQVLNSSSQEMELAKNIEHLAQFAIEQLKQKRAIGGDYKEVQWLLNQRKLNQARLQYITALISAQQSLSSLLQSQGLLVHQQLQNLTDFDRYRVVKLNRENKLRFFIPLWFK